MATDKVFCARIANFVGYGVYINKRADGSWAPNEYRFALDQHAVSIKQHDEVLNPRESDLRGQLVDTSIAEVHGVSSIEDGKALISELCSLLSFAVQSHVVSYAYQYNGRTLRHPVSAQFNSWRPPFYDPDSIASFVNQTWQKFRSIKEARALDPLFHMIVTSDIQGTPLEGQVTTAVQCLESLKSYFALSEGHRFGIVETSYGSFRGPTSKRDLGFKYLLKAALNDVDMPLPSTFPIIRKLRNAIVHRGFIRESDAVTTHIWGAVSRGTMHDAMFETLEHIQDLLREYVLRLLGYRGWYGTYSLSRRELADGSRCGGAPP